MVRPQNHTILPTRRSKRLTKKGYKDPDFLYEDDWHTADHTLTLTPPNTTRRRLTMGSIEIVEEQTLLQDTPHDNSKTGNLQTSNHAGKQPSPQSTPGGNSNISASLFSTPLGLPTTEPRHQPTEDIATVTQADGNQRSSTPFISAAGSVHTSQELQAISPILMRQDTVTISALLQLSDTQQASFADTPVSEILIIKAQLLKATNELSKLTGEKSRLEEHARKLEKELKTKHEKITSLSTLNKKSRKNLEEMEKKVTLLQKDIENEQTNAAETASRNKDREERQQLQIDTLTAQVNSLQPPDAQHRMLYSEAASGSPNQRSQSQLQSGFITIDATGYHGSSPETTRVDPKPEPIFVKGPSCSLSNFYACKIIYDDIVFGSAEHLYQFRKAIFHKRFDLAYHIRHAVHAGKAKDLAYGIVSSQEWFHAKANIMQEILLLKYQQVPKFADDLDASIGRELLHTVKDGYWGTGQEGQNWFGRLLEELRETMRNTSAIGADKVRTTEQIPPKQEKKRTERETSGHPKTPTRSSARVLLTGNSNIKGIGQLLRNNNQCQIKSISLSGANAEQVASRLPYLHSGPEPDMVVIQGLDIDVHDERSTVGDLMTRCDNLLEAAQTTFPSSKKVICGVMATTAPAEKTTAVNKYLHQLCQISNRFHFIDSSQYKAYDGIHYTRYSKKLLAGEIIEVLKTQQYI